MKIALCMLAAMSGLAGSALAQFTVTDGDASLNIVGPVPFSSNLGNGTWKLDGSASPDQLSQLNWYYRTQNNNQNRVFSSLDTPASVVNGDTMTFTYTNTGPGPTGTERFNATITVKIEDGAAANQGRVYTELTVQASPANTAARQYSFFVIGDLDLSGGTPNPGTDDRVEAVNGVALFSEASTTSVAQFAAEAPTFLEVGSGSSIRAKLAGGSVDLGNIAGPTTGDVAASAQWTVTLAPGESRTFRAGLAINLDALTQQPSNCTGDFTGDGFVDDSDFVIFAAAYELFTVPPADAGADLTSDGFVDDADFVLFAAAYEGFVCP